MSVAAQAAAVAAAAAAASARAAPLSRAPSASASLFGMLRSSQCSQQESVGTDEAENLAANLRKAASVVLPGAGLLAAHARKR
jgi:hypothetical protein